MHINKWFLGAACTLVIVAAVAVTWLHAATPTVGTAVASPAYIVVNTPTTVTISVAITDPSLLPGGLNLLQTDASGKTLGTVGVMHDDGLNGDGKAGDRIFSYRLSINQSTVGQVYYRASAAFKGVLQRVLSNVTVITVDPFKLPPDPGEAGKQTLGGIDSDHDGVRDDLQRYIAITYSGDAPLRGALTQLAKATEGFVVSTADATLLLEVDVAKRKANDCLEYLKGVSTGKFVATQLLAEALNTEQRGQAYAQARFNLGPQVYSGTPTNQLAAGCVSQAGP